MSQTKSSNLTYFWHKKTILSFIAIVFVVVIHNSATKQYTTLTPDTITTFSLSPALPFFVITNLVSTSPNSNPAPNLSSFPI